MSAYDTAADALYGAPLGDFVAERKRLAAELRPGDRTAAAAFARLPRPSQSAWAVNQLYRVERAAWDELMSLTERARKGDRSAAEAHRAAVASLTDRAEALLRAAGQAGSELILRRVATNLRAVAATGWPGAPGQLVDDLDEPGFGALQPHVVSPPAGHRAVDPNERNEEGTGAPTRHRRRDEGDAKHDSGRAPSTRPRAPGEREATNEAAPALPPASDEREAQRADAARARAERRERLEDELAAHEDRVDAARRKLTESRATLEALEKMMSDARATHHHLEERLGDEQRALAQARLRLDAEAD